MEYGDLYVRTRAGGITYLGTREVGWNIADKSVAEIMDPSIAHVLAASPKMLAVVQEIAILGAGKCVISKQLAQMARDACDKAYGNTKGKEG